MDKKIGIIFIIILLVITVLAYVFTQPEPKAIGVVAIQSGPSIANQGDNVTITYKVSNNENESIYDVKISSQDFEQNIGTLNPGETRTFTHQVHIPTDKEVQQDFGANATVSNPFYIGGFSVSFSDTSGAKHSVLSNSISINLS